LRDYAVDKLSKLNWLHIQGRTATKGAIFSFTLEGAGHPHDISTIIDQRGIAVRAGHHCAQPLMKHMGVTATARASFGMYNTTEEVDKLADALSFCYEILS
jgi:cysteine desulfurase/selenocysteine lyase